MNRRLNFLIAIGFVVIFVIIQMIAQTAVLFVEMIKDGHLNPEATLSPMGLIISTTVFSVGAIVLFVLLKWSPLSNEGRFVRERPWVLLFWCVLASVGLILPSTYFQEVTMPSEWPEAIQQMIDQTEQTLTLIMSTTGGYAVICLLAPVAEELVFRGAVLRTLLEWKPERRWLMIFLSALLFALAHMNPAQFFHPLLIGMLLGWLYERTHSVLPGIIYHWVNNTAAYLIYHAYPDPDFGVADIFGSQTNALLAVVFSLLIAVPSIYQLYLGLRNR